MGSASSRLLPLESRRQAGNTQLSEPNGRNLLCPLFGETPNRATGTVALPFQFRGFSLIFLNQHELLEKYWS